MHSILVGDPAVYRMIYFTGVPEVNHVLYFSGDPAVYRMISFTGVPEVNHILYFSGGSWSLPCDLFHTHKGTHYRYTLYNNYNNCSKMKIHPVAIHNVHKLI